MPERNPTGSNGDLLEGWKQIAEHLGRTERQVQRWERTADLPVHREIAARGPKVYALRSELDVWRASKQRRPFVAPEPAEADEAVRPADRPKRARGSLLWMVAAIGLLAIGLVVLYESWRPRPSLNALPVPVRPWTRFLWRATAEGGSVPKVKLPENAHLMWIAPDNRHVYLPARGTPLLMELDARTLEVRTIPLSSPVAAVAIAPDSRRLYVGSAAGDLIELEVATRRIEWTIPAKGRIRSLALTPDGQTIYAAMGFQGAHRFDVNTKHWKQLTLVGSPTSVDLDAAGQKLMIGYMNAGPTGRDGHDTVEVLDTSTERRMALFSGPPLVGGMHRFSPDGQYLWLDGDDACSATHYDHQGCAIVPSSIHYLYRLEDDRVIKAVALPPNFSESPRMLPGRDEFFAVQDELIHSFDASRLADMERIVPGPSFRNAVLSSDGETAYLASSDTPFTTAREIWVLKAEPDTCTPKSNEMSNFFAMDGTPNDNLGSSFVTPSGSLRYAPGLVGQALQVEPHGGYPRIVNKGSPLGTLQREFTISFFVKPLTYPDGDPLLGVVRPDGPYWSISAFRDHLQLEVRPFGSHPVSVTANAKLDPSRWMVMAFTKAKGAVSLYIDGNLAGSAPIPEQDNESDSVEPYTHIGGLPSTSKRLHALIDEVAIWPRVLSADELHRVHARRFQLECRTGAMP